MRDRRGTGARRSPRTPSRAPPRPRGGSHRAVPVGTRTRSAPRRPAPRAARARRPAPRPSAPGQPAADVGDVAAQPLGQRLRQLAAGAEVGEHPVAARSLDRGRERPRPGDLDLERAGEPCAVLLERRRGPGRAATGPGGGRCPGASVSRQPAGCRSEPSSATTASVRPVMRGDRATTGELGQVRQVGQLAEDHPDRLAEVLTGHRTHTGRNSSLGAVGAHPRTLTAAQSTR